MPFRFPCLVVKQEGGIGILRNRNSSNMALGWEWLIPALPPIQPSRKSYSLSTDRLPLLYQAPFPCVHLLSQPIILPPSSSPLSAGHLPLSQPWVFPSLSPVGLPSLSAALTRGSALSLSRSPVGLSLSLSLSPVGLPFSLSRSPVTVFWVAFKEGGNAGWIAFLLDFLLPPFSLVIWIVIN
ncbi:Uncharacterized protein TCM_036386 [Theobroma cacao]|uniref:Uncharacterized protein n=1 Tax=Theobroma cacao TaxID=3641 RepID=A0A061FK24_THECC|nr:Uncharacterized protein TCM_036386 [Theobroma cacao]